ncbi:hypothetical protein [Caproicibacter fermentans]|uniref:Lipoprotein n=1 Tax=Caproicibacter fermentans TaxID=2576756 RepID=A0A7G8TA66_9FIRM|nr:hypothetical protein [Caproicibacter fermentans]QNK40507.1 hypothetical protein HCR03_17990 [Caproicibacter fermentans]
MNRKRQLSITLMALTLLLLLVGCQTNKSPVGNSPVSMKTVTQNSKGDLATFEFGVPEGWASGPHYNLSVVACPKDAAEKKFEAEEDSLPFTVSIGNYYYSASAITEEDKQMYKDLFAGKTNAYEKHMKKSFDNAANILSSDQSSKVNPPKIDFNYQHYDGTHGKITEVQYSYTYGGKKHHIIQCYREDIPYLVTGAFDDSVDLSSGKIALWVADSLKVTEHFTVKDNKIQKEG